MWLRFECLTDTGNLPDVEQLRRLFQAERLWPELSRCRISSVMHSLGCQVPGKHSSRLVGNYHFPSPRKAVTAKYVPGRESDFPVQTEPEPMWIDGQCFGEVPLSLNCAVLRKSDLGGIVSILTEALCNLYHVT